MLTAGMPARLTGMVKISFKYMVSGSSVWEPSLNAVVGAVGPITTSYFLNTSSKSCLISVRTFCAFK
ncbi:hypothetical protein D3C87_1913640 [compost metagenome]